MKVIIAGSRSISNPDIVKKAMNNSGFEMFGISEVVCGGARGVDNLGRDWAEDRDIPVSLFPANWDRYGKSAGYRRNVEMADHADALMAVWDGKSKGTEHMINIAVNKDLLVYVYRTDVRRSK